jgi:hypothetical protein
MRIPDAALSLKTFRVVPADYRAEISCGGLDSHLIESCHGDRAVPTVH